MVPELDSRGHAPSRDGILVQVLRTRNNGTDLSGITAHPEEVECTCAISERESRAGLSFPVFGRFWGLPSPPLVRIDHVFTRGLEVRSAGFRPGAGSDHRALVVDLALPPAARSPQ